MPDPDIYGEAPGSPLDALRPLRAAPLPPTPAKPARGRPRRALEAPQIEEVVGFNLRLRASTLDSLEREAKRSGRSMKQVLMLALAEAGTVRISPVDLEDQSPRNRRKRRRAVGGS